jgi:prevent-host-death family protein
MASVVTVHDAKTNLSELLRRVEAGEEIVIARGDQPVAVLSSYKRAARGMLRRAGFGCLEGELVVPDDSALFGPLSSDELDAAFGDSGPLLR